jgi:hypothetical protein
MIMTMMRGKNMPTMMGRGRKRLAVTVGPSGSLWKTNACFIPGWHEY